MKFTCSQSDLNANLSLVSRAVPSRPTNPILSNVLFVADLERGKVSLTAFDGRLGIRTSFNAEVSEGGTLTLTAKHLNDIVSRLPEEEIVLSAEEEEENVLATLTSNSGRYQFRGMSASEFPELPQVEDGKGMRLPVSALSDGLKGVLFAASVDEKSNPILTGVHVAGSQDSLKFAATDSHRLAVVETPMEESSDRDLEDFAVTIPAKALRELERMLTMCQATDDTTLYVDDSQAIFELGDRRLTSLKLEGAYPPYQRLIPDSFTRTATVERKRLVGSLERVSVLAENNLVKFTIDNTQEQLSLSVESKEFGSAKESMNAEITGDSLDIAFNIKYLMDGLKALPSNDIQMQLNEANQPIIFTPLGGLKMIYLVMPVQILR